MSDRSVTTGIVSVSGLIALFCSTGSHSCESDGWIRYLKEPAAFGGERPLGSAEDLSPTRWFYEMKSR